MQITLIVLAAMVGLMIAGKARSDLLALGALLCLVLFGILTPQEAFTGFSNSVIFVMVGMFIISGAIVRTGLASIVSNKVLGLVGNNTLALFMMMLVITAIVGSLVSNTGTVAIMMPIVVNLSLRIDESPSRFLMPLAFMSSIGGMFTLIGNSSNMVVNDAYVGEGYPSLTLFSFFPVGLACFLFGLLVLAPITFRYLSRRKNVKVTVKANGLSMRKLAEKYQLADNVHWLEVTAESAVVGKRLDELHFPEKYGLVIGEIGRAELFGGGFNFNSGKANRFFPGPDTVLRIGDNLRAFGSHTSVYLASGEAKLRVRRTDAALGRERISSIGICELVIMSSSALVNKTVVESGLRPQFGILVLGIQRGNRYILEDIKDQTILAGDALLVEGSWENIGRLQEHSMNWVVVGRPTEHMDKGRLRAKIPLVVTVIALMLVVSILNILPIVVTVLLAAIALVLGGCFKNMDEAYAAINWETLVMLACLLPVSLAMEKTGIIGIVSSAMLSLCDSYGPHVALAAIYAVASAMNIVISTTPVALFITPIALEVAETMGYDPLTFLIAVATGASMCFASPFSTPSNALVMSAGRYTFVDYLKVGLPLQVLMGVVMVFVIPLFFPFTTRV